MGFAGGYLIKSQGGGPSPQEGLTSPQSEASPGLRLGSDSAQQSSFVELGSSGQLGEYGLDAEGRRVFTGARDVTVLQRLAHLHMHDVTGVVELMGQISQMNDEELAAAWEEFCQTEPQRGMGSELLAVQVATRLRAAGMEVTLPGGWGRSEKLLANAFAIDDVRRNPEAYQEKLVAGDELSPHERRALFRALAVDDPAAAAQLWIENSSGDQLLREGQDLAFLMLEPEVRDQLHRFLETQEGPAYDRALLTTSLGYDWALKDPDGFEEWLEGTGNAELKEFSEFLLLSVRSAIDPVEGVAFARTIEGEGMADAMAQASESLGRLEPEVGAQVLAEITDPVQREAAVSGFGYSMVVNHFDEFQEWRETLPQHEQDAVNAASFAVYSMRDPEDAAAWLQTQPEGPQKEALRLKQMVSYSARPLEDQMNLLVTMEEPETRRQAAGLVLQNIEPTDLEAIQQVVDLANFENSSLR